MWEHNYTPVGDSLGLSTLVAAIPLVVLFYLLGVKRKPSWVAGLSGLVVAMILAIGVYSMPVPQAGASMVYGAAFGLFPIGWIVIASLILYRVTLDTGKFEIIKDSIGALSDDRRIQAVLIGFAFGAFIEGAAGFGTPVAVAAAMLTGLGFSPFYAAFICLVANTAPVAFGSLGIPVVTLARVTEMDMGALSSMTGRLCALIAIIIPAYMVVIMSGFKRAFEVAPPVLTCAVTFAVVLFGVTNTIGPEVAVILASIAALLAMVLVLKVWQPSQVFRLEGDVEATSERHTHTTGEVVAAWSPYILLVAFVLVWRYPTDPVGIERRQRRNSGAGASRGHHPSSTADTRTVTVPGRLQLLVALGRGNVVLPVGVCGVPAVGDVTGQVRRHHRICPQAALEAAADDRVGSGGRVRDELRGHDLDARVGVCRHRLTLSVFQCDARVDRRLPDRQRHGVERAVRHASGRDGQRAGLESCAHSLHERRHRSDG